MIVDIANDVSPKVDSFSLLECSLVAVRDGRCVVSYEDFWSECGCKLLDGIEDEGEIVLCLVERKPEAIRMEVALLVSCAARQSRVAFVSHFPRCISK